jgi:hypothetical protein
VAIPFKSLALALLMLVLVGPGCKPVCDQAGLPGVAESFAARSFERRAEGWQALEQTCPTLPPVLARSLRAQFDGTPANLRSQLYADRIHDPAWRELFAQTCLDQPEAVEATQPATREGCRLDRYGLLVRDDVFVDRDVVVFMLYEWLVAGRVNQALAKDIVWPLLSASASTAQLEALCLREAIACEHVVRSWGLQLPRSTSDWPTRGGTGVHITPTGLSVEQAPVLALTAEQPAAAAFTHHVAPALQQALATRAEHEREYAEREATPGQARVNIMADRATPSRTIIATILTARETGHAYPELIVIDEGGLHAIPLYRPDVEPLPHPHMRYERPLAFTFVVHRGFVEARAEGMTSPEVFPNRPSCAPPPAGCHDLEAIATFATKFKALFPHESAVILRVDGDVPLQAVVALIDAVRGEGCHAWGSFERGEEVAPECLFFRPILDAEPPLLFPPRAAGVEPASPRGASPG